MPRRARIHFVSLHSSLINLPISLYGSLVGRAVVRPSTSAQSFLRLTDILRSVLKDWQFTSRSCPELSKLPIRMSKSLKLTLVGLEWPHPPLWLSSTRRMRETRVWRRLKLILSTLKDWDLHWAMWCVLLFGALVCLHREIHVTRLGSKVEIGLLHDLAPAKSVAAEPVSVDDWEILVSYLCSVFTCFVMFMPLRRTRSSMHLMSKVHCYPKFVWLWLGRKSMFGSWAGQGYG